MRFAKGLLALALAINAGGGLACANAEGERVSPDSFGACDDGDPTRERWGANCLCCHADEFGVAGSLPKDAGIATVFVVDNDGRTAEMSPDIFDNFFRHRKLTPPLRATVRFTDGSARSMKSPAPHGSCNACHGTHVAPIGAR